MTGDIPPGPRVHDPDLLLVYPGQGVPARARRAVPRDRRVTGPAAARDLVRRTGQIGVPVVEIGGRPIVGFDQARIDQLLGLTATHA